MSRSGKDAFQSADGFFTKLLICFRLLSLQISSGRLDDLRPRGGAEIFNTRVL